MAALTFPTLTQLVNIGEPTANADAATKYYVDQQIGSGNSNYSNSSGTVTSSSQPNITSVGTLTSLSVSGNITAGNINGGNLVVANFFSGNGSLLTGLVSSNANYSNYAGNAFSVTGSNVTGAVAYATTANAVAGANVSGAVSFATTANAVAGANVSGTVSSATTAGTVTTAAQPNITSTGTLTSVSISGNANVGNIGTTNLVATGAGSFGANVNMSTYWINNVGYPSLSTDAATKAYVDTMISSGISYHQPVAVATTTTLATATGGTTSYVSPNGAANGIGAYISTTGTYLNIDSANVQTVGTRILVKDEANATWNGIYTYANTTAIVRASDADEYGADSTEQLSINDYFFTQGGTVNKGIAYIVSAPAGTITFGTSNITFAQFSSSQVYSAGTGLTLTDTTFSVNASQTQITSVGTLTGLAVNGNITAANITANTGVFTGNGSGLSAIVGANVTGAVSFATTANSVAGGNVSGQVGNALIAGTVYTNAQPNITSVGTLASLSVTGNVTGGNLVTAGKVYSSDIINGGTGIYLSPGPSGYINFFTTGGDKASISDTGNIIASNVIANSTVFAGTANITGNVNAGNASLGNAVTANYFIGNLYGTANLATYATTANAVAGGNVSGQVGNALIAGTVYTNAQPNITSTGTLSSLSVSGTSNLGAVGNVTITGGTNGYVLSTNGSGSLSWVAQSGGGGGASISNGTSNVNIATSGGNVTTSVAGNANIMVVTGTGANINGTLSVTGQTNLGAVGNVVITGGTANYVLKTDGAGTLSWTAQTAGSAANVTVDNFTGNGVQTAFVLSVTPIGINQTSVNYNGATVLRSDYTLLGSTITFSSAPANGSLLEVTTINLTSGGGGASSAAAVGYSLIFGG
jgi:hypothetical protein